MLVAIITLKRSGVECWYNLPAVEFVPLMETFEPLKKSMSENPKYIQVRNC